MGFWDSLVSGFYDRVNAVADVVGVEVDDITQFAVHEAKISEKLFFKELAIINDGFQFQYQSAVNNQVQA